MVAEGGRARGMNVFEVTCMVDLFAVVICRPWRCWGFIQKWGCIVTKIDGASSVYVHDFRRKYRGATRQGR